MVGNDLSEDSVLVPSSVIGGVGFVVPPKSSSIDAPKHGAEERHQNDMSSTFDTLLKELSAEHVREVLALRHEIHRLHSLSESQLQEEDGNGFRSRQEEAMLETDVDGKKALDHAVFSCIEQTMQEPGLHSDVDEPPLCVIIESARGLRNADWNLITNDKSDPYCLCEVPGEADLRFQTKVVCDDLNPVWQHKFVIVASSVVNELRFSVYDRDMGNDQLLGQVTLPRARFWEEGFSGELMLSETGQRSEDAFLKVRIRPSRVPVSSDEQGRWPWPVWLQDSRRLKVSGGCKNQRSSRSQCYHKLADFVNAKTSASEYDGVNRCVLHPGSLWRLRWDIMGMVFLLTDLIWIPLQAFSPPITLPAIIFSCVALLYWTIDMFMRCNTGHVTKNGLIETRHTKIFARYLFTWLPFDLTLVVFDWFLVSQFIASPGGSVNATSMARGGKLARVTRIVRLLRFMRLAKLRKLVFTLQSVIHSEWVTIIFAVGRNLTTLLGINHVLACLWFMLGESGGSEGWVLTGGYENKDWIYQYIVCLHWSISQFTPGAPPVHPNTMAEQVFLVFVLGLGLVMATCFVSSITSTMASVWTLNHYNNTQSVLLRKFLHQNRVSTHLAARITRYVDFVLLLRHSRIHPSRVQFLSLLSGPLNIELQHELFAPRVATHPCFEQLSSTTEATMREICTAVVSNQNFSKADDLFQKNTQAKNMLFLITGSVAYHCKSMKGETIALDAGSWFVEPILWMPWEHRGDMKAVTMSDVVVVNGERFCQVASSCPIAHMICRGYAFSFWQECEELSMKHGLSMTDIPLPVMLDLLRQDEYEMNELAEAERIEAQLFDWEKEKA